MSLNHLSGFVLSTPTIYSPFSIVLLSLYDLANSAPHSWNIFSDELYLILFFLSSPVSQICFVLRISRVQGHTEDQINQNLQDRNLGIWILFPRYIQARVRNTGLKNTRETMRENFNSYVHVVLNIKSSNFMINACDYLQNAFQNNLSKMSV